MAEEVEDVKNSRGGDTERGGAFAFPFPLFLMGRGEDTSIMSRSAGDTEIRLRFSDAVAGSTFVSLIIFMRLGLLTTGTVKVSRESKPPSLGAKVAESGGGSATLGVWNAEADADGSVEDSGDLPNEVEIAISPISPPRFSFDVGEMAIAGGGVADARLAKVGGGCGGCAEFAVDAERDLVSTWVEFEEANMFPE